MADRKCWVCDGPRVERSGDAHDSDERCLDCLYYSAHAYGSFTERIGKWDWHWHHTESLKEQIRRHSASHVARMIRRFELGLAESDEAGFLAGLLANPDDFTTAKVYADFLDEKGRSRDAFYLRAYDDASGWSNS